MDLQSQMFIKQMILFFYLILDCQFHSINRPGQPLNPSRPPQRPNAPPAPLARSRGLRINSQNRPPRHGTSLNVRSSHQSPRRQSNQIPSAANYLNDPTPYTPGAFRVNDPNLFWQAPQIVEPAFIVPEVEASEIPLALAEPIPIHHRWYHYITRKNRNQNHVDISHNNLNLDEEEIPIIRLHEVTINEPITARRLRFGLF